MDIESYNSLNNISSTKEIDIYWQELSNINPTEVNFVSTNFDIMSIDLFDEEYNLRNIKHCMKRKLSNSSLNSLNEKNQYDLFTKKLIIKN